MRVAVSLVVSIVLATPAVAGDLVLPVFTANYPGHDGNRWSSELYVTNRGAVEAQVVFSGFLPGVLEVEHPCLPPLRPLPVPPHTTVLWAASALALDLGCPAFAVGGLVVHAEGEVAVMSRMVNQRGAAAPTPPFLAGVGQEIPALPAAALPSPGAVHILPGLVWDPLSCGPVRFDSYVYLANAGAEAATVTLLAGAGGRPIVLSLDGQEVTTPYAVALPAGTWRRLHVRPGGAWPAVCGAPLPFDLLFSADAAVAVTASVVDRASQDPRPVLPLPTSE
jgi:hypothetical protein